MPESPLNEADTLALMAELRELCAKLARQWAVSEIELHRLIRNFAQPELSAPARSYQFKVEQWDRSEDHVVWLIAVSNNFLVARAAYDAAVKYNPRERWLLRDGIRVLLSDISRNGNAYKVCLDESLHPVGSDLKDRLARR